MRLFPDFATISIPEDRGPPCETAAHRFEDDDVPAPDSTIFDGNVKRKWHGCGRRICVPVHRDHNFLFRQAELLRSNVELSGSNITYTFTGLNKLKPEMIGEANKNARESAEQFARDSGAAVGRIKTASQGYFSVGARDGEDCDDCGSSGGSSPFQKVRVVTTIDYDLG